MPIELYLSSFIVGLLGAGHCLGMCGGISAALTFSIDQSQFARRLALIFSYNIGRILCYMFIGALAAGAGAFAEGMGFAYLRVVAGIVLILMAFYLSGIWKILSVLERIGQTLWQRIQPLGQKILPVKSIGAAMLLGALWGWLPCGLVYSALLLSATHADMLDGAISMLFFGLGTLPAVVAGGLLADGVKQLLSGKWFRNLMALLMLAFGIWTIYGALGHHHHGAGHDQSAHDHSMHEHSVQEAKPNAAGEKEQEQPSEHHHHH